MHVEYVNRGHHQRSTDAGTFRPKRRSQLSQQSTLLPQSQELDRKKAKMKWKRRDSLKSLEQATARTSARIPKASKQSRKENIIDEENTYGKARRSGQLMLVRANDYVQSSGKHTL